MDNLYCNGNETRIDQCQFDGWKIHDCVTNEAAGVICKTEEQIRLQYFQSSHPNQLEVVDFEFIKHKFQVKC